MTTRNEPSQVTIDGTTYLIGMLTPKKSVPLLMKVFKIIGPSMGSALGNVGKGKKDIKNLLDAKVNLSEVIGLLAERIDEDNVMQIIHTLLSTVTPLGEENSSNLSEKFNSYFIGRHLLLFKILIEAAKVQYGDFFPENPTK